MWGEFRCWPCNEPWVVETLFSVPVHTQTAWGRLCEDAPAACWGRLQLHSLPSQTPCAELWPDAPWGPGPEEESNNDLQHEITWPKILTWQNVLVSGDFFRQSNQYCEHYSKPAVARTCAEFLITSTIESEYGGRLRSSTKSHSNFS